MIHKVPTTRFYCCMNGGEVISSNLSMKCDQKSSPITNTHFFYQIEFIDALYERDVRRISNKNPHYDKAVLFLFDARVFYTKIEETYPSSTMVNIFARRSIIRCYFIRLNIVLYQSEFIPICTQNSIQKYFT